MTDLKAMTAEELLKKYANWHRGGELNNPSWQDIHNELLRRLQPEGQPTSSQQRLIGNLLTRWELMTNDFKSMVNEEERNFYEAMHNIVKAVDNGDFWPEPAVAHSSSAPAAEPQPQSVGPRCPKCGGSGISAIKWSCDGCILCIVCIRGDCGFRVESNDIQYLSDFAQFFPPAVPVEQRKPDYWTEYQQAVQRCVKAEARVKELEGQLAEAKHIAKLEMIAKLQSWIGRVGHEDYYKAQAKLLEFEQRAEKAEAELAALVTSKDPNGYPLWFNRTVKGCSDCDSEDLCNKHYVMANRDFVNCEKEIETFILAALSASDKTDE